jgi:DNA-binding winged helix-turn-helix (wHTH) protein/TolB-like protein
MSSPSRIYEFGDFALDAGQQRLSRLGSGETIGLTGKAFDTLVYLVEHAGEPLSKETLLQALWTGVVVEENSLTQTISGLRQILGEARGDNRYIVTLPRVGYRFVAPVRVRTDGAAPAAQDLLHGTPSRFSKRALGWVFGVGLLIAIGCVSILWLSRPQRLPTPSPRTLAVLPFKPLVAAQRNEALELGMSESLIAHLAQSPGRTIRPLSAVRRFGAVDQDAIAAGRELGAEAVIDGLMQREGDRLRVYVRLLQVKDGRQLWAQSFEQPFTRIFAVQDALVAQISAALVWPLPGTSLGARRDTQDPEAYALFASGRFAYLRLTEPSLLLAIDFYERAVARDPGYARAYAGIADCYVLLAVLGTRSPGLVYPKARSAVETALKLNSDLAAAHVSLAQIEMVHEHDLEGAWRELTRAIELDPQYAPTQFYLANLYAFRGDVEGELATFDRAVQLDPYTLAIRAGRALALLHARRYEESIDSLLQILALDDRFDLARSFLMRALLAKGEYQQVLTEMSGREMHAPGSYGFVGQALALSGHRDEARAELSRVLALQKKQHVPAYDIATIYAAMDDADNTFLWLERALDDSPSVGGIPLEPVFDKLHTDARFGRFVVQLRTPRQGIQAMPCFHSTAADSPC